MIRFFSRFLTYDRRIQSSCESKPPQPMARKLLIPLSVCFMAFSSHASSGDLNFPPVEVDMELVLAADRSASMSRLMVVKQRKGFAAAFRNERLQQTIRSGPLGRIAVVYFEWSDRSDQTIKVPWTLIETPDDFERFAAALDDLEIGHPNRETAIGAALLFSQKLLDSNSYTAPRQVIDVSSNGRNSDGPTPSDALAILGPHGTTINGLVLPAADDTRNADSALEDYFWREVIGGPGAFAISVHPRRQFERAILRKLVLEVAQNG